MSKGPEFPTPEELFHHTNGDIEIETGSAEPQDDKNLNKSPREGQLQVTGYFSVGSGILPIIKVPSPYEMGQRIKYLEEKAKRAREEQSGDISQSTGGDFDISTGDSTPKDK